MGEFKLSINRNPGEAPKTGKLAEAKAAREEAAGLIRARRAQIHERHKLEQSQLDEDDAADRDRPKEPLPERENIESIEFTLPNGLEIEYGPPAGVSLLARLTDFFGDRDPTVAQHRLARILMCVRKIGGKDVAPITNEIAKTKLANRIGDDGLDIIMYYDRTYWPPLMKAELPVVKKKLKE